LTTLVSACLLGFACRHDARHKRDDRVLRAIQDLDVVPVCPEMAAGFPAPRAPAWQDAGRVVDGAGNDLTARFHEGARAAVQAARAFGATRAILKQNSPSCGTQMTGTALGRQPGEGIAARALREAGVATMGEDGIE
jgi:uncharacterized protein YbbK (DUF523 family)